MNFKTEEAIEILTKTPSVLNSLLRGLSDSWTRCDEGEETWSAFDVVGHLIEGERNDWIPRAMIILNKGESETFKPFDRFAHLERNQDKTLELLLDEFDSLRKESLVKLKEIVKDEENLDLKGTHPVFGTVTLRQLISTWVVHDLNHIGQIVRVMSKRYDRDVGPWKQYLGILSK